MNSDRTGARQADRQAWTAEDLDVFRLAYDVSLAVHRASLEFPKIEQYSGLADQLRRASKSVCSLIVEGVGRQTASSSEFARHLTMAIGSAEEARLCGVAMRAISVTLTNARRGIGVNATAKSCAC